MNIPKMNERTSGPSTITAGEGNPYLQSVETERLNLRTDAENGLDEEAQAEALHCAEEKKKRKQRRRRWVALGFILMLLAASIGLATVLYRQRTTKVEYGKAANQNGVLPPPANVSATTTRDSRHEQAIQEVHRLSETRRLQNFDRQVTAATNSQNLANENAGNTPSQSQHPFTISSSSTETNNARSYEKESSSNSSTPNDQRSVRSQRNFETSLYVGERDEELTQPTARSSDRSTMKSGTPKAEKPETTVPTPPFGSVLPVRVSGGLYTLRSGALARFELTRDMIRNSWAMKRGTILIGLTKGGESDRAYVSIIGFIDPQSGKLVKLGGDVLGSDGMAGLKGKSRQVDTHWTRVLSQVGNAAVTLTGALLAGRSNGTVVISDGARSPLINPISDELSGMLGARSDRNRPSQFVEVVAGTPGYVMVTDLPAAIKGTDANGALDEQTVAALADIDATRPVTGISEREFAELLGNGSPDEIKAKLHRMSPEMRKIALVVLER